MEKRDAYQQKLQAQLDEWSADIDKLKAKTNKASAQAQIEHKEQIADLQSKREDAVKKMQQLQQAGEDSWEEMRSGLEAAWNDLAVAVKSARSKFS